MAFDHEEAEAYYVSHDAGDWTIVRRKDRTIIAYLDTYKGAHDECAALITQEASWRYDRDDARAIHNTVNGDGYGDDIVTTNEGEISDHVKLRVDVGMEARKAAYETKDSGERAEFSTGMVRDTDDGKPRFDLLFPQAVPYDEQMLTRFAQLMERGAKKYSERNWEKAQTVEELDRYKSSALRHLLQWFNGEVDEDHAAAVYFNLMGAEYVKRQLRTSGDIE